MKNIILAAITVLSVSQVAQAQQARRDVFSCYNHIYRESSLKSDDFTISIKDSSAGGADLPAALDKLFGFAPGLLHIQSLELQLNKNNICTYSTDYQVECSSSSVKDGSLTINAWVTSAAKKIYGDISLSLLVPVQSFKLSSKLRGSASKSYPENEIDVKASATVTVDGKDIDLTWETFFSTIADPSGQNQFGCQ
jgi:hypothetical protein